MTTSGTDHVGPRAGDAVRTASGPGAAQRGGPPGTTAT
ncbi:hypothetical protein J2S66_002720 [Saccharothrix longispora]|uniref:Uncharacterized protein n=1 Tax=Saccharothrix longispora TaxID=33920 RepID=A0ABU1PV53_9PSEU|nr:hypothetical protein [Saccharothrix longispora]